MKHYIILTTVDKQPVIFYSALTYKGAMKFIESYKKNVDRFEKSDVYKEYWKVNNEIESPQFQRTLHTIGPSGTLGMKLSLREKLKNKYIHRAETLELILTNRGSVFEMKGDPENFIHVINRPKFIDLSL